MKEILEVVSELKTRYADSLRKKKRVQKWLEKFSSFVTYYGAVLDTLAPQHTEYVALAWGTMKFVFVGILNHGELVVQFSKALTQIGKVLPRQELNAALFPMTRIKEAVFFLYAHVIKFLKQAVKWYQMGPTSRAFFAIRKPFDLDLMNTIEEIAACSKIIDQIAVRANMAELRDVHIDVGDLHLRIKALHLKVENILQLALGMSQLARTPDLREVAHVDLSMATGPLSARMYDSWPGHTPGYRGSLDGDLGQRTEKYHEYTVDET